MAKKMMQPPKGWADDPSSAGDVGHARNPHEYTVGCDVSPGCKRVDTEPGPERPEPAEPLTPRASALNEACDLITGDRNNQYGPPTQDFARTADLLNALGYRRVDAEDLVHEVKASDVAIIIAQVKVSRLMHSRGKRDSWVDLAGYAACGYECATEEEESSG